MKKNCFKLLSLAAAVSLCAVACNDDKPVNDPKVVVTSVSLDQNTLSLVAGATGTLKATVAPENATNKEIEWSSGDTAIATVDQQGVVTAIAAGQATIKATSKENAGKFGSCVVTVTPAPVSATGISLNETTLTMETGDTKTLTATVMPESATDKTVTWTSSHPDVAIVNLETGLITAVAAGQTTVTATTADGTDLTANCIVTVLRVADIYIAGTDGGKAVVWKNGSKTELEGGVSTTGLFVSGSDVYVSGNYSTFTSTALYWKNGVKTVLSETNGVANGITVVGGDIYVVGKNQATNPQNAGYWKNGVWTAVVETSVNSLGNGIAVTSNDVYVAGYALNEFWEQEAAYWKNNTRQTLDGTGLFTNCVTASGNDVYVGGCARDANWKNKPALWKNGVLQTLNDVGVSGDNIVESGEIKSIVVANGKVYAAGKQMFSEALDKHAVIWTDGVGTMLSDNVSEAWQVFVEGNDVYVVGEVQMTEGENQRWRATLWKNGEIKWQESESTIGTYGKSVFVVR